MHSTSPRSKNIIKLLHSCFIGISIVKLLKHSIYTTNTPIAVLPQVITPMSLKIKYEVFGKIQGVFFRKYTKKKADELGIKGWCMNTKSGTVKGEAMGTKEKIDSFKTYLRSQGSPKSSIDKAVINEVDSLSKNLADFQIIR